MGLEIERKFLVDPDKLKLVAGSQGSYFRQGYLLAQPDKTIRVRVTEDAGFLTIKGITVGAARQEFDYPIPKEEAVELLDQFAENELAKMRYKIQHEGHTWEVDEFLDLNAPLIIAEIELTREDEPFTLPDWVTEEVTDDKRYYNSYLSAHPYQKW